jgi:cob(I)alamin adenosyltransferase
MSIVTKTGDQGMTALMFNRRVPKSHPRIEACGDVDELNAALGLARAAARPPFIQDTLLMIQKDLVVVMGELATSSEDLARYVQSGHTLVTAALTARLDKLVDEIEAQDVRLDGWATPGASQLSAALDLARTVCRRAERRACALQDAGQLHSAEILPYLNRLSDLLWLLARWTEAQEPGKNGPNLGFREPEK